MYICSMQNSALLVGHGDRDTFDRMYLIYLFYPSAKTFYFWGVTEIYSNQ